MRILGILEMTGDRLTILDRPGLVHLSEFDLHYLYIADDLAT